MLPSGSPRSSRRQRQGPESIGREDFRPHGGVGPSIELGYFPDKSIEKAAGLILWPGPAALVNLTI
jgi:hypothetical protein